MPKWRSRSIVTDKTLVSRWGSPGKSPLITCRRVTARGVACCCAHPIASIDAPESNETNESRVHRRLLRLKWVVRLLLLQIAVSSHVSQQGDGEDRCDESDHGADGRSDLKRQRVGIAGRAQ